MSRSVKFENTFRKFEDKSTCNIVLRTKGASPFKVRFLNSNRVPNKNAVAKIKASLEQTNALHLKPLIAYYDEDTNTLWLIDGQHRYEAAKSLGIPVHIKVTYKYNPLWMSVLNCNQKNWTLRNFADMWKTDGPQAKTYQIFVSYLTLYDISAGLLVALFQTAPIEISKMEATGNLRRDN